MQVKREQKVGNFTLAFQDVEHADGLPAAHASPASTTAATRRRGDFGVGWRLDVQTPAPARDRHHGQRLGHRLHRRAGPFGIPIPTYVLYDTAPTRWRSRCPTARWRSSTSRPRRAAASLNPIGPVSLVYTPRPGTLGSLAPVVAATYAPSGDTGDGGADRLRRRRSRPARLPLHHARTARLPHRQVRRRAAGRSAPTARP